MYLNIFKVLDVHNAENFEKFVSTKSVKNCKYHVLLMKIELYQNNKYALCVMLR